MTMKQVGRVHGVRGSIEGSRSCMPFGYEFSIDEGSGGQDSLTLRITMPESCIIETEDGQHERSTTLVVRGGLELAELAIAGDYLITQLALLLEEITGIELVKERHHPHHTLGASARIEVPGGLAVSLVGQEFETLH